MYARGVCPVALIAHGPFANNSPVRVRVAVAVDIAGAPAAVGDFWIARHFFVWNREKRGRFRAIRSCGAFSTDFNKVRLFNR